MDKRCSKCEIIKPVEDFGFQKEKPDGHKYLCKICEKENAKKYRQEKRNEILAYQKEYRQTHKKNIFEHMREYRQKHRKEITDHAREYRQTEKGKEVANRIYKKQREKYPEKFKARKAVNHAVEYGELPRIDTMICSVCNERQAEHYHHHCGYEEKYWLVVIPVCAVCHKIVG